MPPEKKNDFEVVVHRDVVFKVIVVGDPEVGKTSLIKKFTRERFEKDYIPTVGVNIAKHIVKWHQRITKTKHGDSKNA